MGVQQIKRRAGVGGGEVHPFNPIPGSSSEVGSYISSSRHPFTVFVFLTKPLGMLDRG